MSASKPNFRPAYWQTMITIYLFLSGIAIVWAQQSRADETLIGNVKAERTVSGLTLTGTIAKVPSGTKIRVEIVAHGGRALKAIDQPGDDAIVGQDGFFRANLSSRNGAPLGAGSYTIRISAMFNRGWQSIDVLKKAGVELDNQGRSQVNTDPKMLPETRDFKPFDPEFPNAGRYIDVRREVVLSELGADAAAIEAVKKARLTVQGRGRSDLVIEKSVQLFASAPGFIARGWSAVQGAGGNWIVSLDCVDGGKETKAQWGYDPKTKGVKYLDALAKTLSYVPPE